MKLYRRAILSTLLLLPLALQPALAHDYTVGDLGIAHPWAKPTPPAAPVGGAYLSIVNKGKGADRLIRASSPAAGLVELHSMRMEGNVMRMRAVPGIDLPPGKTVTLAPGGLHVMLQQLKQPLKAGERIPLTLVFQKAGPVKVELTIEDAPAAPAAAAPAHGDMHKGH